MQHVENDLDNTIEKLSQTNLKFDEKDKLYQLARARRRRSTGSWCCWRTSCKGPSQNWPPPPRISVKPPPGPMTSTRPSRFLRRRT